MDLKKNLRGDTSKEMILSQKTCQEQQRSIIYRILPENKVNMVGFFFKWKLNVIYLKKSALQEGKRGEFIHDAGVYLHGNLPSRK